jgi:hypothetical protein
MKRAAATLIVLAAAAAAGGAAPSPAREDALVPAADLLEAPAPAQGMPALGGRIASGGAPWRGITGAGSLHPGIDGAEEMEPQPWLDGGDLAALVGVLSGGKVASAVVEGGSVRVPAAQVAATEAALARIRGALPPVVEVDAWLEEVPGTGPARVLAGGRDAVRAGALVSLGEFQERATVTDFDVEIAESASIADPIVVAVRSGATVALRVRPFPARATALVEAFVRTAEDAKSDPIDTGHPGFGRLDRAKMRIGEAAVSFLVDAGKPAEIHLGGRDGRNLRLRVTARWTPAAPAPEGAEVAFASTTLVGGEALAFGNHETPPPPAERTEVRAPASIPLGIDTPVAAALEHREASAIAARDSGVVAFQGPAAVAAARAFDAWFAAQLVPCAAEVLVASVPSGAAVAADKPLPEGAQVLARAAGPMILGLSGVFNDAVEQGYLHDWDVEVAQSARIPDPIVWRVGDGHTMELRLLGGPGSRPAEARVRLELTRLEGIDRVEFPLGQDLPGRVRSGGSGDAKGGSASETRLTLSPALPAESVALERPTLRRLALDVAVPLGADGTAVLRRAAPGLAGPGREVVVILRAR